MRIKLTESNMDLVMSVVRSKGISLVDSINYLLENPDIIKYTRGVNVQEKMQPKSGEKN